MRKEIIVKNLIAHSQIEELSRECKNHHIKFILLKGAALIELFDKYSFERDMEDIDILVEEKNYEKFIEILKKLGYTQSKEDPNVMLSKGKLKLDITTHLWYLNKKENFEVINRAMKVKDFYVLSLSDMIKHIFFHSLFEHGYLEEKWLNDIELIKLHFNIEPKIEMPISRLVRFMLRLNFYYKGHIVKFLILPWKKKLVYLFNCLFPSKEFMKKRYNVKISLFLPFFYFYRIFSVVLKLFDIINNLSISQLLKLFPKLS